MTDWARWKLDYHNRMYGDAARLWEDAQDDRRVFHAMYFSIAEAIKAVQGINNLTVQLALNRLIKSKYEEMEEIYCRFCAE